MAALPGKESPKTAAGIRCQASGWREGKDPEFFPKGEGKDPIPSEGSEETVRDPGACEGTGPAFPAGVSEGSQSRSKRKYGSQKERPETICQTQRTDYRYVDR